MSVPQKMAATSSRSASAQRVLGEELDFAIGESPAPLAGPKWYEDRLITANQGAGATLNAGSETQYDFDISALTPADMYSTVIQGTYLGPTPNAGTAPQMAWVPPFSRIQVKGSGGTTLIDLTNCQQYFK